MRPRKSVLLAAIGAALAVAGATVSVVFLFQPWRSCPYDDSPAACATFPVDALILAIAVGGTLIGSPLLACGLVLSRRRRLDEIQRRAA